MNDELLQEITSRGYYIVNFNPAPESSVLKTLPECERLVRESKVRLRGWDYPHFPSGVNGKSALVPTASYLEGWTNLRHHKELWRMYKNGRFTHYKSFVEDWTKEYDLPTRTVIEPLTVLGIDGSIVYPVTEIIEFLRRLVIKGLYADGVELRISLHNLKDRTLWLDFGPRHSLDQEYRCFQDTIESVRMIEPREILFDSDEMAMEIILDILHVFNWEYPPRNALSKERSDFLAGMA